ncbi:MAG: V-type ATP synthase subunit E [Spirochaetales bacterium]|nr:V-type ATP synthase subunit E [Spirochaetales bacterium]
MDVQLKELIEKIKSEGVKTAEEQAAEIIRKAELKAAEIIENAESQAKIARDTASSDAARFEATGNEALKQASRDLIISTSKKLEDVFNNLLKGEVEAVLKGDFLEKVILTVIKNWKKDIEDISVLLPPDQVSKLESGVRAKISKEISSGIDIKPLSGINSGFRITSKDGSAYFDFSGAGISDLLSELLNPKIAALLQEAASGEE